MVSGDGRDSDGDSSKTVEGHAATPVPTPEPAPRVSASDRGATLTPEEAALGGAQTAVATKSQQMRATDPPMDTVEAPLIGQTLTGRYQITRQIGAGGMGAVYEAKHTLIGKRVAVKVLLEKYAAKDSVVARLEQEARLASSIGHSNIIDITDFGETDDGRRFVVMEYLEGESLGERLKREGPLPTQRIAHICVQIASALGAAHRKGVIHRDVKPENVFLVGRDDDRDFVKVVDFGISKALRTAEGSADESPRLTQTGMVLGTPLYMSPEQARGDEQLDHRIDIYALGVIMYELATGEVPFRGSNYLNIISQVLSAEPKPPREVRPDLPISEELEAITLKAMARDRDERYQTMEEMANDLKALAGGGEVGAVSGSFWSMRRRAGRRSPLRVAAWIGAVAVVIAAVAVSISALMAGDGAGGGAGRQAAAVAIDAAVRAAVPVDAGVRAPVADVIEIELTSEPAGATVWADGGRRRICAATPCTWAAVKKDQTVDLIFELAGYDDAQVSLNPLTAQSPQLVRLSKPRKGKKRKQLRKHSGGSDAHGGATGVDDTVGGELQGNPIKKKRNDQQER